MWQLLLPVGKGNFMYPLCNPARSLSLLKLAKHPRDKIFYVLVGWGGSGTVGRRSGADYRVGRVIKMACYRVFENRRRTCTATSTLTKIFVWAMECGVNYHLL